MSEDAKLALSVVGVVIAIIGGAVVLTLALVNWECSNYSEVTGRKTRVAAGSCYIEDGGQWYAWAEYKHRFVANGALFQK